MLKRSIVTALLLVGTLATFTAWRTQSVHGASTPPVSTWNRTAAATFLDQRELWWQAWPRAQKDHGTVCLSCHTNVPYAMVRPTLRCDLHATTLTPAEQSMLANVEKRVTDWDKMEPFYSDAKNGVGKTVEAHNTEAVLNAIVLSSHDTRLGHLRPITVTAFDHAWALQSATGDLAGSWVWQNFHLGPWEGDESGYQHTALLTLSVYEAPDSYAHCPDVQPHLAAMRAYLRAHYATQPLLNQLYVLWASQYDPALLTPGDRKALLATLQQDQQPDGGWNTFALDHHERADGSPAPTASDGYATAIAVLALEAAGPPNAAALTRGIAWLSTHQQPNGAWLAESINKDRNPDTDPALFMTDAATAYAVLALDNTK
jgi:squalene-hopene/tetraprenyl-beta-curcumene cyclase